jgi:hypothetical protein
MHKSSSTTSWYANHFNNVLRVVGFLVLVAVATLIYNALLRDIITGRSHFWAYLILWLFTAYIVLPRLYRLISKLFLPDYFIGRTQTADGLLGDPVNLAFLGNETDFRTAMVRAGWTLADPVTLASSWRIAYAAVFGKPYASAPVSPLYLFGHRQDFAYERDTGDNPRKRHHVRFWKTPDHWWLPGGYQADWLGAATYDENVGLSLFTGQITHKIDANVDAERDYLIQSLEASGSLVKVHTVEHFTTSYHARNGGGDIIHTDGALPFITLD